MFIRGAGSPAASYQIARSLRFNSADSAYLNKTLVSGSTTQWTFSCWVKRGNLGTVQNIFSGGAPSFRNSIGFDTSNRFSFDDSGGPLLLSTAVFRDPSAWFHLVVVRDDGNGNNLLKMRVYINNVEITTWTTDSRSAFGGAGYLNGAQAHTIGQWVGTTQDFDGYLAEIYFIGGSVLTSSDFGETNATTGAWGPKSYTGSFSGTNSFRLSFSDNSNTTAATLGADTSGNGNNWTPNSFSITAGVGNDSLTDSPTSYGVDTGVGGEVRGNFATLNPVRGTVGGSAPTLANGNLQFTGVATSSAISTQALTGKVYCEAYVNTIASALEYGIGRYIAVAHNNTVTAANTKWSLYYNTAYYWHNGAAITEATTGTPSGAWITAVADIALFAIDVPNSKIWIGRNKSGIVTWAGGGDPAAGTAPTFGPSGGDGYYSTAVDLTAADWFLWLGSYDTGVWHFNAGQRPFSATAPSGFKALCTQNLSTPAIAKPKQYFDTAIYTGTGASLAISTDGSTANNALALAPDLVWIKGRSGATDHGIYDNVRGVQKDWGSNLTTDETSQAQGVTAFGSTGFTVGTLAKLNTSAATYVSWLWKAGGAAASNTVGSITSSVSVNTTAGVSALTYTGTGANATIGHGIGVAPSMVVVKARTTAGADQGAVVWHASLTTPTTAYLVLSTAAALASATTMWNSTIPTSTVFSVGTNASTNTSGDTYVAYAFSPVEGFSKFGSYTGSTDGPFVWCGFRPRYVLIKRTDSASDWYIWDTVRDTYNVMTATLLADTAGAETSATSIDALSNGFKCRSATVVNVSSGTYSFSAFAESPFKTARAR